MTNRLDQALVERGLCESRERAKRAIMAGAVTINQTPARKPSDRVESSDKIEVIAPERYVSRGGYKLEHALKHFQIDVSDASAIDVGASTGGFTDCLLQHGAAKIYAVDVGRAQLAWNLRKDRRVNVMEGINARDLAREKFRKGFEPVDIVVVDCSFISIKKILPVIPDLLKMGGRIVALIKPQFEAGKREADKGAGVIRDPEIHRRVLREIEEFVRGVATMRWRGATESPLTGPAGNKEFLALIEKTS